MDYKRVYENLIEKAKKEFRIKGRGVYYEGHHIIPKSKGGTGKSNDWISNHPNIVLLTAKEHYLAHHLLVRLYPKDAEMILAYSAMFKGGGDAYNNRYNPSPLAYKERNELLNLIWDGTVVCKKIESKIKTKNTRSKRRTNSGNKPPNPEWDHFKFGIDNPKSQPILQKDMITGEIIAVHGSLREASRSTLISRTGIRMVLSGAWGFTKGYIFEYVDRKKYKELVGTYDNKHYI
jgi:hypothetical protein